MALKQGRYTFRHDTVLWEIVSSLNTFIGSIESVVSKEQNFIKFVKKGTKVKQKKTPHVGTLHRSVDWILKADSDKKCNFPLHIAYTELQPDITIYANSAKKVLLIELTCPCEENMEKWHDHKINKYLPLKSAIKSRGWEVDLHAIEVGARGFCSRSLLCCLWNLGFNNILAKKTLKTVSKLSMESSFCIWLARDNVAWQSVELNAPLPNTHPPESLSPSIPKAKIKNSLPNSLTCSKSPVGFINKGNTCYANTILQALSVIPLLWRTSSAEFAQLSPLLKLIALNMAIKERSTVPIDPSNFLWAFKSKISSTHSALFDFNSLEEVAEILQEVQIMGRWDRWCVVNLY